jgi:hypothetical protein
MQSGGFAATSLRRIVNSAASPLLPLGKGTAAPPESFQQDCFSGRGRISIMLGTILIIVLLLLLLGAWPAWPHSAGWGYYPSGTLGLVLLIVVVLALTGRI